MIIEKVDRYVEIKIQNWPCNTNRASEIGHECERYLVFLRTRGNEKKIHGIDSEYIFREGNVQERAVLALLAEAGIEVIEQQRPFEWKECQLTGHVDGKILHEQRILPMEIKSMAPWIWDKIKTVEDMLNSNYYWVRKYPAQLTMYEMMDCKELAIFITKNKSTGRLREIPISLDYSYAEFLVRKCERINAAIAEEVIPEPISWGDTCSKCPFNHICIQTVLRDELQFIADPDAEEKLDGWFELKQWHDKWKELDEWRKEHFKGVERIVIGPYLITGKALSKGWKTTITKI